MVVAVWIIFVNSWVGKNNRVGGGDDDYSDTTWTPERLRAAARFRRAIGHALAICQILLAAYYALGFGVTRHWLAAIAWGAASLRWDRLSCSRVRRFNSKG